MIILTYLVTGIALGFAGAYLFFRSQFSGVRQLADEKIRSSESIATSLKEEAQSAKADLVAERTKSEVLQIGITRLQSENVHLLEKLSEQKSQLEDIQDRFTKEFENLANRILDEKSKKFGEQNENQLRNILDPLKDRIRDFEKRVNDTHTESEKERRGLKEQLLMLTDMNKRMSEETLNLTRALKGDSKKQGNWGELILEKVLEKSGLQKGREYDVQQSFTIEDGSRLQPDVVIHLPENKNLIVDSKVSLVAYERYIAADENDRPLIDASLREHLASLRNHIKGLSSKNYQNLYGIGSPDFVILFIPIEAAFALSIGADNELYNEAFEKNVVLVSPTTLLATLRTIANVWKQEYQNQNAQEIARQGGDMYDKFVSFTEDLIKVGKQMDESKKTYSEAMNKLVDGRGNLVRRAEVLRELGVKAGKMLPKGLIDRSID